MHYIVYTEGLELQIEGPYESWTEATIGMENLSELKPRIPKKISYVPDTYTSEPDVRQFLTGSV